MADIMRDSKEEEKKACVSTPDQDSRCSNVMGEREGKGKRRKRIASIQ